MTLFRRHWLIFVAFAAILPTACTSVTIDRTVASAPYTCERVDPNGDDTFCSCLSVSPEELAPCLSMLNQRIQGRFEKISEVIGATLLQVKGVTLSLNDEGAPACPGPNLVRAKVTSSPISVSFQMGSTPTTATATFRGILSELKIKVADGKTWGKLGRISVGRGTVADYREVIQALACQKPEAFVNVDAAESYLDSFGVGIDCAGSVQLMLQAATEVSPLERLGLHDSLNEGFFYQQMSRAPNFKQLLDPKDFRPGDVIPLGPPVTCDAGHVVIIKRSSFELAQVEVHEKTLKSFVKCPGSHESSEKDPSFDASVGDPIVRLEVASSWGYGKGPNTYFYLYNLKTGKWGAQGSDGAYTFKPSGPYDHSYHGAYRSKFLKPQVAVTR